MAEDEESFLILYHFEYMQDFKWMRLQSLEIQQKYNIYNTTNTEIQQIQLPVPLL